MGLDVGCGANCIYPLIGSSVYGWRFVGTDITENAVHYARRNVYRNPKIRNLIDIAKIPDSCSEILLPVMQQFASFHFCMCNPPFFNSIEDAGQNKRTAFGGTTEEMVYPGQPSVSVHLTAYAGGEYAFVERMVNESVQIGHRIVWYSAMLGKKSTLKAVRPSCFHLFKQQSHAQIRTKLHSIGVAALRTTSFNQGKMTRWAIAWSFSAQNTNDKPLRASNLLAASDTPKHILSIEVAAHPQKPGSELFVLVRVTERQVMTC